MLELEREEWQMELLLNLVPVFVAVGLFLVVYLFMGTALKMFDYMMTGITC